MSNWKTKGHRKKKATQNTWRRWSSVNTDSSHDFRFAFDDEEDVFLLINAYNCIQKSKNTSNRGKGGICFSGKLEKGGEQEENEVDITGIENQVRSAWGNVNSFPWKVIFQDDFLEWSDTEEVEEDKDEDEAEDEDTTP